MDNELWFIVASGFLNQLLTDIQSITDKNERKLLLEYDVFTSKLIWMGKESTSVGYVVHPNKMKRLYDYITELEFNPRYRDDITPRPSGVSESGGTISCDSLSEHTAMLYRWSDEQFSLVGDLASNSSPGAGNYVISYHDDLNNIPGLPSAFVSVT